jgi:hypothetical protein
MNPASFHRFPQGFGPMRRQFCQACRDSSKIEGAFLFIFLLVVWAGGNYVEIFEEVHAHKLDHLELEPPQGARERILPPALSRGGYFFICGF